MWVFDSVGNRGKGRWVEPEGGVTCERMDN